MIRFSTQVTIAASLQRVWHVLADFERWPEWTPTMRRVERVGPGNVGVGSGVHIEQPKLRPAVWTITSWNPGHEFTWISRNLGVNVTAEHTVETVADGSSVKLSMTFAGFFGALIGLLSRSLINRYLVIEAAGLKQRCESPTS
jgi:uncharacterized protein YndB with AHSA1/START domain